MSHCVYGHWVVIVCLIAWRFDYNRKNENEIHFERNVNSAIRTHMKASLSLESCVCRAHSSDYLLRMDFELKVGRMYLTCAFFIHVCGFFFAFIHSHFLFFSQRAAYWAFLLCLLLFFYDIVCGIWHILLLIVRRLNVCVNNAY